MIDRARTGEKRGRLAWRLWSSRVAAMASGSCARGEEGEVGEDVGGSTWRREAVAGGWGRLGWAGAVRKGAGGVGRVGRARVKGRERERWAEGKQPKVGLGILISFLNLFNSSNSFKL